MKKKRSNKTKVQKPLEILIKIPELKDGPGWSPDGGNFWVKDNLIYWHDGDITPVGIMRMMRGKGWGGEDYSAWAPEHRAAVKAQADAERAEYLEEQAEEKRMRDVLVDSAKSKLTEEEFSAVVSLG